METDGTTPPVDLEGFRSAMREAGIEEIVEDTLKVYLDQAKTTFADLEAARARNDTEGMGSAAHSLKSASRNIWATRLGNLLDTLEATSVSGDLNNAMAIFEDVRPEYAAVISYLEGRDRSPAPPSRYDRED